MGVDLSEHKNMGLQIFPCGVVFILHKIINENVFISINIKGIDKNKPMIYV